MYTNIKILWNKFRHWLQVGQAKILHTQEMLTCQKNFIFSFNFTDFGCQTCESLNVNATLHSTCNSSNHGSLHWSNLDPTVSLTAVTLPVQRYMKANKELFTQTGQTVFTIFCFQKMFKTTKLVPKCFMLPIEHCCNVLCS